MSVLFGCLSGGYDEFLRLDRGVPSSSVTDTSPPCTIPVSRHPRSTAGARDRRQARAPRLHAHPADRVSASATSSPANGSLLAPAGGHRAPPASAPARRGPISQVAASQATTPPPDDHNSGRNLCAGSSRHARSTGRASRSPGRFGEGRRRRAGVEHDRVPGSNGAGASRPASSTWTVFSPASRPRSLG